MKITITYNMPDDEDAYRLAQNAKGAARVIEDWSELLRAHRKYGAAAPTEDDWFQLLREHGVEL